MTKQTKQEWLRQEVKKCLTVEGKISEEVIGEVYHQYAMYDNGKIWCNNIQFCLEFGYGYNSFKLCLIDDTFSCECYDDSGEATLDLPFKVIKQLISIAEQYKEME